ncbi:SCY1-like protein 2, partial [Operophtera brumata]
MEVFNKFYSSVSNTVSQLSGLLWKIYKGYKKSTKQEASIFVFEKKHLERWSKADRDIMLETLKRGIVHLTKLRHPQILTVQHSLEESRESLAFATEPVFASLANILGNTENMPQPIPNHIVNYKLFELEIKYGLMQVAEGLAFLHNDVKLLHHNVSPESIIVNQQGAWKIFGFDFCIANQSSPGAASFWPFNEYCQAMPPLTQPVLDYLAPEYILSATHSPASDIFSLGMVIYALHSTGHQTLGNIGNDYMKFKRYVNELRSLPPSRLSCVADGLKEYVKLMLNVTPELRPDPHQFLKKSQFYKGLPQIIQKMPHRICIYRILPCLTKEFVNPPMVPFVLPNVLLIAENSSKEEYIKYILPVLKPVMLIQDPIQILLIFMQKMELLLKLTPGEEVKTDILPMLYRALESDAQQIQELCLSVLPTFASLIDYPAMKNALMPRIKKLCMTTNYISVRVNCLLCLGKLLEHLDKWLVLDEIIPFLPQIPSREPAVLMGILGIYKLALSHKKLGITKEVMATKVLPFLIPLCVENGLTLNQFNALIALVKQMVSKVEAEHRAKLEQLNSIQSESRIAQQQESARKLSHQPRPTAILAPPKTMSKPTDLTSSLLQSNLSALSQKSNTTSAGTSQNVMSPYSNITSPNMSYNASAMSNQNANMTYNAPGMTNQSANLSYNPSSMTNQSANLSYNAPGMTNQSANLSYNASSMTNQNSMNYNASTNTSFGYQSQAQNAPMPFDNQLALPPTTWSNSGNTNASNFNNKWTTNQTNSNLKQDWSAFESLLPSQSNTNNNGNTK